VAAAALLLAALLEAAPLRRVNVPYLGAAEPAADFVPAIFWFGSVSMTSNYADVRVWYFDSNIQFVVHIPDRLLWYDTAPTPATLTAWDAVSIYLDLSGNTGQAPGPTSYWFVKQLQSSQAAFRGTGSGWTLGTTSFTGASSWRGNYPNDSVWDVGWQAEFRIPFSSLGLSGPPAPGSTWGLGVVVHDRDEAVNPDQTWPETFQNLRPSTWGQLRFGRPVYTPPTSVVTGATVVRQGLDGATVVDAAVGGHGDCGGARNAWTEWGNANYAGYDQFNIQNQWDVADFMCFSKYYVTFPLTGVPPGKSIISARVRLNLFGNAGYNPGDARPSAINALTVSEDWLESTITWNNAPYAEQNISVTWVYPIDNAHPAGPYDWDVSYAAAEAYRQGQPLRLAFYSTDGDYHSGKYFWSSNVGDWNAAARPALEIRWGDGAAQPSACDVNGDGSTNVVDVQLQVNQALGIVACTSDINRDGACNVIDVQRVVNAALGGACVSP